MVILDLYTDPSDLSPANAALGAVGLATGRHAIPPPPTSKLLAEYRSESGA